ncbi:MAG: hypothetical protein KDC34_01565 [Saprospiraceae bacterium]|nr:hypothetical protein [Saprospiraceae bacterium]
MCAKEKAQAPVRVEKERQQFRALLLANPNYFGNLEKSPFKAVKKIQSNSNYESIGCVGFQPQFNRLEAVVFIKNPSGYGGTICSNGTPEYVRFYISCDKGKSWDDLGLSSFRAYDVPEGTAGSKRLEYATSLQINPSKRWCFLEKICQVRAILSWNQAPPANQPNWQPVWGDVHNTHIQIDPRKFFLVSDLVLDSKIELSKEFQAVVDLDQEIPVKEKPVLSLLDKYELYKKEEVSPARFAMQEMQQYVSKAQVADAGLSQTFAQIGINVSDYLDILYPKDGNVSYEELECVGYNPKLETLVATLRVKKSSGYLGSLCKAGSREYVTFYADFNNNGYYETCLGTTSVGVHDIKSMPKEGLEYAAFLPVNFSKHKKPCGEGPVVIPIRAILSWNVPAPCWNPNHVPVYGNREDTLICLEPGAVSQPGTHFPIIQTAGSMDVGSINGLGYANGPAALAGFTADDSPFGGQVVLTGHIGNTTDFSAGATKLKYKVEISENNGISWQRVDNSFTLYRDQLLNGIWSDLPSVLQSVDVDGFYTYQEDLVGGPGNAQIFPVGNVLARWNTGTLSGRWIVRIIAKNPVTNQTWSSNVVAVHLDNKKPDVAIQITSGGGDCADFRVGDVISGTYSASDAHFNALTLKILPTTINGNPSGGSFTAPAPLPAGSTMPLSRRYSAGVPTIGENGNWSLDTTGMRRCGYVVEIGVTDRAILNSGGIGHYDRATVGLCLRNPNE